MAEEAAWKQWWLELNEAFGDSVVPEDFRIVPKAEHDALMTALENAAVVPDWGGGSLIDARSWDGIRRAMAAYLPMCEQERTDE